MAVGQKIDNQNENNTGTKSTKKIKKDK
jgi:hypothetical protein